MSLKTLCPAHAMASVTESFTIDSMIRGYNVYRDVWLSFMKKWYIYCHDEGSGEGPFGFGTAAKQKCPLF